MNERLKALYKEVILQHSKEPFHFGKKEDCDHVIVANNPVCGDNYKFYVNAGKQTLKDVYFHGFGCAISKASNAVLVQLISDQDLKKAYVTCCAFLDYLDNRNNAPKTMTDPAFEAFSAVHEFPSRMDCATLGWREMKKFLENMKEVRYSAQ